MNTEKWMNKTDERINIVSLYIEHLKDNSVEFPYSDRILRKALQTILPLAIKHRNLIESSFYKRAEKKYLETERPEAPFTE